MKEEPEIVKQLRGEEKQGSLKTKSKLTYKQVNIQKEKMDVPFVKKDVTSECLVNPSNDINDLYNFQNFYKILFGTSSIAITLTDKDERIISWNKHAEELLKMNESDLYLKPVSSLYPSDQWRRIRAENVRQKGIRYRMETQMIRKNKESFDVELSLCVLKGAQGKIAGTIGIIKDISNLKLSERRLKESEERYKIIFENSAVAITLTDRDEKIISWNKYAEELLGMDKNDLLMKPVSSLYPVEEWKKIRDKNVRQRGMRHSMETKVLNKNNELIDVDLSLSVLKNHEEQVIGSIGVLKDITYQKWAKNALEESEKKFKQLYENAPIPYHTLSPSAEITSVNARWCRLLGYAKKEVMGKPIFNFIKENEREKAKISFAKKMEEKKSYTGGHERTYITKNGQERIFIIHDHFSFDKDKNVSAVHTTMEDITQRQHTMDEIVKSEEKYRVLAETSADGVMSTDVLGCLTYLNPSIKNILGRKESEILGKPFRNYLAESSVYLYQQAFLDIRKKEVKMENIALDVIHKDGYEIPIEINISPLKKNKEFIGIECTVRDITDRKRIERELKRSEKLRTEFMNIIAHELKSPITPIKGYLELIETDKNVDDKVKNWAKIGLRNAERLMRLVNDILDVSRLDTDTMRFNMEKCDLTEIFNDAIEDIKPDIKNKNLKFLKDIPDQIPKIVCDKYRILQVLKNLLGNAIKFTDYGSISLRAVEKEKHLLIYIEDTGIGISSDETKKIFTKFYQAYTGEDRKNEGTGLGLFICKEILKKHNGDIWAESRIGKGSKFIIKLPF
jgi:PAS domain S-box-containing protein